MPQARPKRPWQDIVREAQGRRDESVALVTPKLPKLPDPLPATVVGVPSQILTLEELKITEMLPEDLLKSLASGSLTTAAVTAAFLRRAVVAQKLVSSLS